MITDDQIREAAGIDLHPADVERISVMLPAGVTARTLQVEVFECLQGLMDADDADPSLSAAARNW